MSAEPEGRIAFLEAAIAAFNREGVESFLEYATPDITLATASGFPGGGRFEGGVQVEIYVHEFSANWAEVRYECENARLVEGAVVHLSRWVVRGQGQTEEISAEVYGVASFRDEKIAALELFWTEEEAERHARRAR